MSAKTIETTVSGEAAESRGEKNNREKAVKIVTAKDRKVKHGAIDFIH